MSNRNTNNNTHETVLRDNARTVSHRDLPPINHKHTRDGTGSILLFYQYIEPTWTVTEHKSALKKVIELGNMYHITGRGRVAPEGLNCTLTGRSEDVRSFCCGLRKWKDIFYETDFKITDGLSTGKWFKSLSIRKANELVAYGLAGGMLSMSCSVLLCLCAHFYGCVCVCVCFFFSFLFQHDRNRNEDSRAAVRSPLSRRRLALHEVPVGMAGVKCCSYRSYDYL